MNEESFEKIQRLMRVIGGKAIVVENGEPSFIIASVDEYTDFSDKKEPLNSEVALIEKINQDILVWKNRQRERELGQMEKNLSKSTEMASIREDSFLGDRI
jgi:hypothetical protein